MNDTCDNLITNYFAISVKNSENDWRIVYRIVTFGHFTYPTLREFFSKLRGELAKRGILDFIRSYFEIIQLVSFTRERILSILRRGETRVNDCFVLPSRLLRATRHANPRKKYNRGTLYRYVLCFVRQNNRNKAAQKDSFKRHLAARAPARIKIRFVVAEKTKVVKMKPDTTNGRVMRHDKTKQG